MINYPDTEAGALAVLENGAAPELLDAVYEGMHSGYALVPDPHCPGVWGLRQAGRAVRVVVYTATGDFEADETFTREGIL